MNASRCPQRATKAAESPMRWHLKRLSTDERWDYKAVA